MKYKKVLLLLLIVIGIQFIPFGKDHINLPVIAEPTWDTMQTRQLFMRACGDCHSLQTRWPWYSDIAPVSWLIERDVVEGREHFNVSAWGVQKKNKGNEAAQEVREGAMPLGIYTLVHSEAKLAEGEKQLLIQGLAATFGEKERSKK